jgi:hypothetical protein
MGVGDQEETNWSGGVTARGAAIAGVEPWRFDAGDSMLPGNHWRMTTHRTRVFGGEAIPTGGARGTLFQAPTTVAPRPFSANGIIVLLTGETEDSSIEVGSPLGVFSVRLNEIPYGRTKSGLNGKALAEGSLNCGASL